MVATTRLVAFLYHSRQDSQVSTHLAVPSLVDLSTIRSTQSVGLGNGEPFRTVGCVAGSVLPQVSPDGVFRMVHIKVVHRKRQVVPACEAKVRRLMKIQWAAGCTHLFYRGPRKRKGPPQVALAFPSQVVS